MNSAHVDIFKERDRPALVHMLEDAGDLNLETVGMYRRRRDMPDVLLVAWVGDSLVGMLNASYNADLHGKPSFESFDLPPRPHVFIDRIHVHPTVRRAGVGRALIEALVRVAGDHDCTFAGGHVDATSDPTGRVEFFERLQFEIHGHPPNLTAGLFL